MTAEVHYTLDEISRLLDLTPRRVQQLVSLNVIPKSDRGRYPLVGAVQGYVHYLKERAMPMDLPEKEQRKKKPEDDEALSYHTEKARLTKNQADMAELELLKMQGQVASIEDFERVQSKRMGEIKTKMLNIPQRAVLQLLGETDERKFKTKLRDEITLALQEAASADDDLLDDDNGEGDDERAAP